MRFTNDTSPLKRALAVAVIALTTERDVSIRRQQEAAAEAERERRLAARRYQDRRLFDMMMAESASVVKLNVGGVEISTSRATLLAAPKSSPLEVMFSGRHGEPPSVAFIDADPTAFSFVIRYLRAVKQGVLPATAAGDLRVPDDLRGVVVETARQLKIVALVDALTQSTPAEPSTRALTWHDVALSRVPLKWVRCDTQLDERNRSDVGKDDIQHYLDKGYIPFGDREIIGDKVFQLLMMPVAEAHKIRHCKRCAEIYHHYQSPLSVCPPALWAATACGKHVQWRHVPMVVLQDVG